MPQRIPQGEGTACQLNIPGFLQCRFAVGGACKYAVLHTAVSQIVQGPFLVELLVFDDVHWMIS
jgi:hypothetical protein